MCCSTMGQGGMCVELRLGCVYLYIYRGLFFLVGAIGRIVASQKCPHCNSQNVSIS